MTAKYIGLDFETFGAVDLRKHGLDRYVNDSSFTPLIASVHTDDGGSWTFDFILDPDARENFVAYVRAVFANEFKFIAHNAGFERAVLGTMSFNPNQLRRGIVDSAVIARCQGAGSHLETAAPQLTNLAKLSQGLDGIKLFSVPNDWNLGKAPTRQLILDNGKDSHEKWFEFIEYCERDAEASAAIGNTYHENWSHSTSVENVYEQLTAAMNEYGWRVDMDLVHEMQYRYERNVEEALAAFRGNFDPDEKLNFNSPLQLKAWCKERGVRTTSFDEEHVTKLLKQVIDKLLTTLSFDPKWNGYNEVRALLETKQILGGSSLKKLQTIIDTVGTDGRLRNQYMHVGAGQSYRTSGRGVQMQNLKRLSAEPMDMGQLMAQDGEDFSNDQLAENLRQVFTSSHEDGHLIVGDFRSVESRGLAWLAGAEWKLNAFRIGRDLYKVQASAIYHKDYESITKAERQTGKVGELSCGYGAGPGAVVPFAKAMGVEMTEEEALELVRAWRKANPEIVDLWDRLDAGLHEAVASSNSVHVDLAHGLQLRFRHINTPISLQNQHPGAQSIQVVLHHLGAGKTVLERTFHGMYSRGRNICYYKPSDRKGGNLWVGSYTDPKTSKLRFYDVYGGKLAGILTQSFCRELFFQSVQQMDALLRPVKNAQIVGQFHDEIVVDWVPGKHDLEQVRTLLRMAMTTLDHMFEGFPLDAEIKSAYRYIK